MLGFDKYWKYDKQTEQPYMWAEANHYYYRGTLVAKLKGGNIYTPPEIIISEDENGNPVKPEMNGNYLRPVDITAMVEANQEMIEIIEQTTVKKILAIYTKYKNKLDCFHVAFSGGKDSCVLLDLVKKALPKGSFVVVFGDTGMEFPDTYEVIEKIKQQCIEDEIPFYTAKSHLDPKQSWELFGPPSRVLRWCCSVHKSTPQILKLREITGKNDYTGLAFVGVRAHESATRAEYDYFNDGKKIKGQYNHNSILEWTSAEIWLYMYANDIFINEAYRRGSSRVGCVCCPMAGNIGEYKNKVLYPEIINQFIKLIRNTNSKTFTDVLFEEFMVHGAWKTRADGKFIKGVAKKYYEETKDGKTLITIKNPLSDWREWIKTLNWDIPINVNPIEDGYTVSVSESDLKTNPSMAKIFRQIFKKAVSCSACTVCMANCKNGCITFENMKVRINDCRHCLGCHNLPNGCLLYDSLKIPKGETTMGKVRSINSFQTHAPKYDWMKSFFDNKEDFFDVNTLAKPQQTKFNVFLEDAKLSKSKTFSHFAELLCSLGWETGTAMGLMLVNLVSNNPQFEWYIKNLDIGQVYMRTNVIVMLMNNEIGDTQAGHIASAFKRLVETPLGTSLHFGHVTNEGDIVRTKCSVSDPRVVLYGLFKFAEKCNDYKEFTLATLLNDSIERDGISPTRIFGLDRDDMMPMLLGLSAKYPEFITASFTHDLEKITLAEDKSSQDVLALFKGDITNG